MMRKRGHQLEEALRAADPLSGGARTQGSASEEELLTSIFASPLSPPPSAERQARRSHRVRGRALRRHLLALPLGAALLAILLVGLPGGGGGSSLSTLPVLARVAAAAAA